MKKPKIEVKLEEKVLVVNGEKLKLNQSLSGAKLEFIHNLKGGYVLSLIYESLEIWKEGDFISEFLEMWNLLDKREESDSEGMQVYSGNYLDGRSRVGLAGYMDAVINS